MAFNPNEHMTDLSRDPRKPRLYLETKWRQVWFREDHPTGKIVTELLQVEPFPLFKASIIDKGGELLATGHGSAIDKGGAVWSGRAIEKAETAAIGRALANAGYGTQFTDDDDDGYLADAPVEPKANGNGKKAPIPFDSITAELPKPSGTQWTAAEAQEWVRRNSSDTFDANALKQALGIKERWGEWTGDADSATKRLTAWMEAQK